MTDRREPAISYDPGGDFWSDFVRRFWGRRPTVIRQPFAQAIASPEEVFAAMVAATNRLHSDDLDFVFAIDGSRAGAEDVERCLPTRSDRSLDRLADRIAGHLSGGSFTIFVRAIQLELGWDFWTRVRSFLTGPTRWWACRRIARRSISSLEATSDPDAGSTSIQATCSAS